MLRTFMRLKSVYVCPVPTKNIGWPVVYVMLSAAPTLRERVVS